MKQKHLENFSQYLLGTFFTFVFVVLAAVIIFSKVPVLYVLMLSFASYIFIHLILSSKLSSIIFYVLSGIAALFTTFVCWVETPVSKHVLRIVEGIIELWYKIFYNYSYQSHDLVQSAWAFLALFAVISSICVNYLFSKYFSLYIISGLVVSMSLFSWYMTAKESHLVFILSSCLFIVSYLKHVYLKKKKAGLVDENIPINVFMLFTLPIALIPAIAIQFMPRSDMPLEWPWLDSKIAKAISYLEQRYSYSNVEFFSLSSTGFSGTTYRLGGPAVPNNTIVMDVKADKRTYLRGAVYSWYENNSWVQFRNEDEKNTISKELDSEVWETRNGWDYIPVHEMFPQASQEQRELLYNISQGTADDILFPSFPIEVKLRNMSTRTMFMPVKSILPVVDSNGEQLNIFVNPLGNSYSDVKLSRGAVYSYQYIQPMYGEPMLWEALSFSRKNLYKDALDILIIKRNVMEAGNAGKDELEEMDNRIKSLSQLYRRATAIEEQYTALNDAIPQRVKDLAFQLTKDCENDYQKVVAVEKYLRENYFYTLSPNNIPPETDFVDYFLFEDGQGYCTYYATAMTILLRSAGIPARYAEGYVLPEKAYNEDIFTVTNINAHAWVEVYFEGFGWLTFEPTSTYANVMNYRQSYGTGDLGYLPEEYRPDDFRNRFGEEYNVYGYYPIDADYTGRNFKSYYIPIICVALSLVLVFTDKIAGIIRRIRYGKMNNNQKVIRLYKDWIAWLSRIGYHIKPGETARDFSRRIDGQFYFESLDLETATQVFYKVRYGGLDVSLEEIKALQVFSDELKAAVLKELGLRRFIPLRLIILGI